MRAANCHERLKIVCFSSSKRRSSVYHDAGMVEASASGASASYLSIISFRLGFIDPGIDYSSCALSQVGKVGLPPPFLVQSKRSGGKPTFLTCETSQGTSGRPTRLNDRCRGFLFRIVKGRLHHLCPHSMSHRFNRNFDLDARGRL